MGGQAILAEQYYIPIANLLILLAIYIRLSMFANRMTKLEEWRVAHEKSDDERHDYRADQITDLHRRIDRHGMP